MIRRLFILIRFFILTGIVAWLFVSGLYLLYEFIVWDWSTNYKVYGIWVRLTWLVFFIGYTFIKIISKPTPKENPTEK